MKRQPKYVAGDKILFSFGSQTKEGIIRIVDPCGTMEQQKEPSYDIEVREENRLYKHIVESDVLKKKE